jgi:ribosomal protein S18 acetylase RimI-like enzyme
MSIDLETDTRTSSLEKQIEVQTQDLEWTLAHFAFVANVTTLMNECDIAHSPGMSVASCHRLPLTALAFVGDSADLLANYATFLTDPGSDVYLIVNEEQRAVVETAFDVVETIPQWQMVFRGSVADLDPGTAVQLNERDESAIQSLAEVGELRLIERDPLASGPAFGIRKGRRLISMATTRVQVPNAAEIGNVVTHEEHRRKGYSSMVISALVRALVEQELCVFLRVFQNKPACIALYEKLGFEITRPMYLMRCVVKAS